MAKQLSIVLLLLFTIQAVISKEFTVDVLILGGGVSGITAANHLYNNNIKNFLILEAQDYVGGRLKNITFGGHTFSEGANWIHFLEQGDHNPILRIAKKLKLQWAEENQYDAAVRNLADGERVYNETYKTLDKISDEIIKENKDSAICEDKALSTALQEKGWIPDTSIKKAVEWIIFTFEYGDTPKHTSTRQYTGYARENGFVTSPIGYAALVEHLRQNFTDQFKLNTVVTDIDYSSTNVVKVKTANGDIYIANYTLCTFSTGVLASSLVKFLPDLPSWKTNTIKKLPLAYYTHILVRFSESFWEDREALIDGGNDTGKYMYIVNMNIKPFYPGSNILLFAAIAKNSIRVENQADSKTIDEVMEVLEKMYPEKNISRPIEYFVSKWSKNPYVRGSYSNAVVGTTSADFNNLAGRMNNLFFSGEATTEEYWGFVQGAYNTGLNQAKAIGSCYYGNKCEAYEVQDATESCTSAGRTLHLHVMPRIIVAMVTIAALTWKF